MDKSVDKTVTRPSGNRVPTVSPTVSPEGHGATVSPCPLPSGHGTRSHVPATVSFSRDMVESGEGVIGVPELLRLDVERLVMSRLCQGTHPAKFAIPTSPGSDTEWRDAVRIAATAVDLCLASPTEAYRCAGRPVHTARTSLADLDRSDKAVA